MEDTTKRIGLQVGLGGGLDRLSEDLSAKGKQPKTGESAAGEPIRVYDPSVKFISLPNSVHVRKLGRLGEG